MSHKLDVFTAAKAGDWKSVERLLRVGCDANLRDSNEQTLLLIALRSADMPSGADAGAVHATVLAHIQLLLQQGADPNRGDRQLCQFPLHEATARGFLDVVALLLHHGADPNQPILLDSHLANYMGFDGTPLHVAAALGEAAIAELLIQHAAHVDALGHSGQTPLHVAAKEGRVAVADVLLRHGADVNATCKRTWDDEYLESETPLHVAVAFLQPAMVRFLLSHGAASGLKDAHGCSPWARAKARQFRARAIGGDFTDQWLEAIQIALKPALDSKSGEQPHLDSPERKP